MQYIAQGYMLQKRTKEMSLKKKRNLKKKVLFNIFKFLGVFLVMTKEK